MRLFLRLYLLVVLTTFCLPLSANTSEYIFEQLTLDDGLPSLEISQIFQQSNGFIWFTTSRGAIRYDGYTFRHFYFSPNSKNHISNNFVTKILEDSLGNIWLATEDGLNRINIDGSIDIFKVSDGLPSSWILTIFIDSTDRLWIGTGEGLVWYSRATETFHKIGSEKSVKIIGETANGDILISTEDELKKVASDGATLTQIQTKHQALANIGADYIVDFKLLANGWLAIGTEYSGLYFVDFDNDVFKHFNQASGLLENAVSTIEVIAEDEIWLGHYAKGITILNLATSNTSTVQHRQFDAYSIASNVIKDVFKDRSGIIWVATDAGVSKLTPQQGGIKIYRALPKNEGISGDFVYTSTPFGEGQMLISSEVGIDVLDNNTGEITTNFLNTFVSDTVKVNDIWSLANHHNEIWMASSKGLGLIDIKAQTLRFFSNTKDNDYGLPAQPLYTILPEPNGGVWFTGYSKVGLSLFHPDKGVIRRFMHSDESDYTKEGNFSYETILSSRGDIWMATTDGLFRVNRESGAHQHYKLGGTAQKRDYIRVSSVREGKAGVFWATTQGLGLVRIQTIPGSTEVEITYFTTKQGLPSNELSALAVDENTLWITSNSELIKFTIKSAEIQVFKNLFGVKNLKFMNASAHLKGNKLFVSSSKGFVEIDTKALSLSQFAPMVEITQVFSDKESVYQSINKKSMGENFIQELAGDDVEFYFASLDYTKPDNNRFRYRLLGLDEQWSDATYTHHAAYSNLLPGHYTFQVKASNSDNVWSNNITQLSIYVAVPYWYYALSALVLITLLLIVQFVLVRRRQIKLLEQQLRSDTLTSLPNRFDFQQKFTKLISKPNNAFALVVLDLDNLKDANDIYGHKVGDEYIKLASVRMLANIREQDYLARLSGDEFVILLNSDKLDKDLVKVIGRLTANLSQPYLIDNIIVNGSASLGVATFPKDGDNEHDLFIHADSAMYEAKKAGRNQAYFFNASLKNKLADRIKIKSSLKYALSNQEFELYYQAKLNPITRSIEGFEALIRWIHPVEGLIPPDKFITEAENNGSIAEIGQWVIETACQHAAELHNKGILKGNISVNVSPKQIHTSDILNIVINALVDNALPPEKLELEITESFLMDESDKTSLLLASLKNIGISIALDDFGSGYSSLNYLTKYPISTLKIDRSIISQASEQEASLLVLRNIYSLAHSMGMKVVAEGIETVEQANLLLQYKDDLVQGFLYSRPVPFEEARQLLIENAAVK